MPLAGSFPNPIRDWLATAPPSCVIPAPVLVLSGTSKISIEFWKMEFNSAKTHFWLHRGWVKYMMNPAPGLDSFLTSFFFKGDYDYSYGTPTIIDFIMRMWRFGFGFVAQVFYSITTGVVADGLESNDFEVTPVYPYVNTDVNTLPTGVRAAQYQDRFVNAPIGILGALQVSYWSTAAQRTANGIRGDRPCNMARLFHTINLEYGATSATYNTSSYTIPNVADPTYSPDYGFPFLWF